MDSPQDRRGRRRGLVSRVLRERPGLLVVLAFAALIALGTGALLLPGMRTGDAARASFEEALFTSTSAVTVTGLSIVDTETGWTLLGQVVILVLISLGGFGIMTLSTLLVFVVLRRLGLRSRLLTRAETPWLQIGEVRRILLGVVVMTATIEGVTAVALAARWWRHYDYALPDAAWHGLFHSVSAFNNAGFALQGDSLVGYADDPVILVALAIAIILGGLGFPVLMELWAGRARPILRPSRWSLHTRLMLVWTAVLVLGGWLAITGFEWGNDDTFGPHPLGWKVLNGFFASVTARTAGFNTFDYGTASDSTLLTTDFLMFVGGGSASTAGGVKVTTVVVLLLLVVAEIRGRRDVEVADRRLAVPTVRTAVVVVAVSALTVGLSTYALLAVTPFNLQQSLFEAISALSTTGLTTGITAGLGTGAELLITLLMFVGRVGVITFASALALRGGGTLYRLPEGRPLVG